MGEAEAAQGGDIMQRVKSAPTSSSSCSAVSPSNASSGAVFLRHYYPSSFGYDATRRPGIPPIPLPPASRFPSPTVAAVHAAFHSRFLSQPPAFFVLDSLPPPPYAVAGAAEASAGARMYHAAGLPPRKAHRRSQSDLPVGFLQPFSPSSLPNPSSLALLPQQPWLSSHQVKQEAEWEKETESSAEGVSDRKSEGGDAEDDLFSAYMNIDNLDALNFSEMEEKPDDLESSRLSGTRMNSADTSENEAESIISESGGGEKEGSKRSAAGDPAPIPPLHLRSLSMDSLMGKLNFGFESPKLPPSPGNEMATLSRGGSMDGNSNLDFANGEFNSAEIKKIIANEKLAEMALSDPKRVKRMLANRQSAARSKERKMRYISELEHKVQTLQTEATTLSTQLTLLQRDSAGLVGQNNELRIRLQAMEQHAQLRDAINEALTAELQRLKLAAGESTDAHLSKCMNRPATRTTPFNQLQSQKQSLPSAPAAPLHQFQSPQLQQQQQQSDDAAAPTLEPKK